MSEYSLQILNEDDDDVGEAIPLTEYLGGNKSPSSLLDVINSRIDEVEDDENSDEDDD